MSWLACYVKERLLVLSANRLWVDGQFDGRLRIGDWWHCCTYVFLKVGRKHCRHIALHHLKHGGCFGIEEGLLEKGEGRESLVDGSNGAFFFSRV